MFQFHNGSIKAGFANKSNSRKISFNSTMVRLKLLAIACLVGATFQFQFHNGSIKASWEPEAKAEFIRVSIPQWFD